MTTPLHTLEQVDDGWAAYLAGLTVNAVAVPVFLEMPSTRVYAEKKFPSVSVSLIAGPLPESSLREGARDDEEIGHDDVPTPPESIMREVPEPERVTYTVDVWVLGRAADFRNLVQQVRNKLKKHFALPLTGGVSVWGFRTGSKTRTEVDGDEVVYHHAFTVDVIVYLGSDATSRVRRITSMGLSVLQSNPPAGGSAADGPLTLDLQLLVEG